MDKLSINTNHQKSKNSNHQTFKKFPLLDYRRVTKPSRDHAEPFVRCTDLHAQVSETLLAANDTNQLSDDFTLCSGWWFEPL